jgi:hypothetical protein
MLEFIRKIQYVRLVIFIIVFLIAGLQALQPNLEGGALNATTFILAILGVIKSFLPSTNVKQ